jgi:hypothetical protein
MLWQIYRGGGKDIGEGGENLKTVEKTVRQVANYFFLKSSMMLINHTSELFGRVLKF